MDPQRFKEAFEQLEALDERLTYKIRPRRGGPLLRPSQEQLEEQLRDVARYVLELKAVLRELFLAIGGKPGKQA